jgi:hypothetical protein
MLRTDGTPTEEMLPRDHGIVFTMIIVAHLVATSLWLMDLKDEVRRYHETCTTPTEE